MSSAPTGSRRIVLAENPRASFGRSAGAGEEAAAALRAAGFTVEHCRAADYGALLAMARTALQEPSAALVVVGGDGMVHLGAGLLAGGTLPLGVVPTGTGNDFAHGLGLPVGDVVAAVSRIVAALATGPRSIDAVRVERSDGSLAGWYAGVLSAGFDAVVNERANRMRRPRGASRYVLALLRELAVLRPLRYRITVDGVPEEASAMLVSVANNGRIGGGMRIVPDAELDDGMLDLFLVRPLGRLAFLRIFPRVFRGTHTGHPAVSIRRCRRVEIDAPGIRAFADGESMGPLPLRVEVVPGALRVLI